MVRLRLVWNVRFNLLVRLRLLNRDSFPGAEGKAFHAARVPHERFGFIGIKFFIFRFFLFAGPLKILVREKI